MGLSALAVAILFTLLAAARLRVAADWVVAALMVSGLAGGLLAGVYWSGGADSRWLVGGILLVLGESAALLGRRFAALRIATLVLGVLATALLAIAAATAR